jgi:hypothetical protein
LALDFPYEQSEYTKLIGKKFQVLIVEDTPAYIPFIAASDGDNIRRNAIYARRGTSSEEANYEELQEMLNRRLETGYSSRNEFDLEKHLTELRVLYTHIPRFYNPMDEMVEMIRGGSRNPRYPKEDYETFVKRLIEEKKKIIEKTVSQT